MTLAGLTGSVLVRRVAAWGASALVVAGLLTLGAVASSVWQVRGDVQRLGASVEDLRAAVGQGDAARVEGAVASFVDSARTVRARTDGLRWRIAERLPLLGDDAEAISALGTAADDVGAERLRSVAALPELLDAIAPQDGRIDLTSVAGLAAPLDAAGDGLARLDAAVQGALSQDLVTVLRDRVARLGAQLADARGAVDAAALAADLAPAMLGADGPRRYLLVLQNNAEVRATGGIPGSVALLEADAGQLRLRFQAAGRSFPPLDEPVLPLSDGEERVYGDLLGVFFQNATMTPDFLRAAELMTARFGQRFTGTPVDGVLSLDTVSLSYLLGAIGPVEVDGTLLDQGNATAELLHEVYLDRSEPADQDAFFRDVVSVVFERLTAGAGSPRTLVEALVRSVEEGRTQLWSADAEEQQALSGRAIQRSLEDPGPTIWVTLDDATGGKMSYFLTSEVETRAVSCAADRQELRMRLRLASTADPTVELPDSVTAGGRFGTRAGDQLVVVRVHSPRGGDVTGFLLNQDPAGLDVVESDLGQVGTAVLTLSPGESATLDWQARTAAGEIGDVTVRRTPGLTGASEQLVESAC